MKKLLVYSVCLYSLALNSAERQGPIAYTPEQKREQQIQFWADWYKEGRPKPVTPDKLQQAALALLAAPVPSAKPVSSSGSK